MGDLVRGGERVYLIKPYDTISPPFQERHHLYHPILWD